jgi:hypothetical protein
MVRKLRLSLFSAMLSISPVRAQSTDHSGMNMATMNASGMGLMEAASGTAVNPASWAMPMLMNHYGAWNTTLMGQGFLIDTQQSGPRGGDKFYSSNWFMGSAQRRAGAKGTFQAELMLSLEPATVTDRRYPLLFQTGETAFGKLLVDAQHPHNFVMALGFHYVRQLSQGITLETYFAPVGDPALGPVAFPHRASALELPQATLSHHWQDATHIADDVATVGLALKKVRIEASGFHGAEPGENRWIIESGAIDSWSARLWLFPTRNWSAQVSTGRLTNPERLDPGDQMRTTASLHYSKPVTGGSWSSSFIWGRNHSTATKRDLNSYLLESVLPINRKNFLSARAELVDKDELFSGQPEIERHLDLLYGSTFREGSYTVGYTRDIDLFRYLETGIGANFSIYSLPDAIKPYYGGRPIGGNIFIRFRIRAAAS